MYADFGYPDDMSAFIYYMPTKDELPPTKREGEVNMITKFDRYLMKLKDEIETNRV